MSEISRPKPEEVTQQRDPEVSTALVSIGRESSLARVSEVDVMQAELETGSMELVGELFAMAANIREYSSEQKQIMLEQVVSLLKKLEIEANINGDTEKVSWIQQVLSFIPKIQKEIRIIEKNKQRTKRIAEARRQLIVGAKQLADGLGIDISGSIPELQEKRNDKKERIDQLELYLGRLETYLSDPAIKHGVRVYSWHRADRDSWSLVDGYIVADAIKAKSLILQSSKEKK